MLLKPIFLSPKSDYFIENMRFYDETTHHSVRYYKFSTKTPEQDTMFYISSSTTTKFKEYDIIQFVSTRYVYYPILWIHAKNKAHLFANQFLFSVVPSRFSNIQMIAIFLLLFKGCILTNVPNAKIFKYIYEKANTYSSTHIFSKFYPPTDGLNNIKEQLVGWLSQETADFLKYTIQQLQPHIFYELGTWYGISTRHILQHMPAKSRTYCFDRFQDVASSPGYYKYHNPANTFYMNAPRIETVCKNLQPWAKQDKIGGLIQCDIYDVFQIVKQSKLPIPDVIFIDFIKSAKKLRVFLLRILRHFPNTVIVGDDAVVSYVYTTVQELKPEFERIGYTVFLGKDAYILAPTAVASTLFRRIERKYRNLIDVPFVQQLSLGQTLENANTVQELTQIANTFYAQNISPNAKLEDVYYSIRLATIIYTMYPEREHYDLRNTLFAKLTHNKPVKRMKNQYGLTYIDYLHYSIPL